MTLKKHWLLTVTILLFSIFTTTSVLAADQPVRKVNPVDPYEPFNRVMFRFNDAFDTVILRPAATLYIKIVPRPLAKGISNFFSNIDTIPTVLNDVLQINIYQATSDAWRLLLNSTIGILGFFDVATPMGLERNSEDLGLTFAQWGWKQSNYLVIPFLGPSTVRDTVAWPINYQYMTIYPYINPVRDRYAFYSVNVVSKRADYLRFQNVMEQAALDKYVFLRDAYMQRRAYQIKRNKELDDPYLSNNDLVEKNNDNNDSTQTEKTPA